MSHFFRDFSHPVTRRWKTSFKRQKVLQVFRFEHTCKVTTFETHDEFLVLGTKIFIHRFIPQVKSHVRLKSVVSERRATNSRYELKYYTDSLLGNDAVFVMESRPSFNLSTHENSGAVAITSAAAKTYLLDPTSQNAILRK